MRYAGVGRADKGCGPFSTGSLDEPVLKVALAPPPPGYRAQTLSYRFVTRTGIKGPL